MNRTWTWWLRDWARTTLLLVMVVLAGGGACFADDAPVEIFGYFQNSFEHQTKSEKSHAEGTFSLQQLNLFFQKDISPDWRAFVNFEFINSFSAQQQWGSANLEEAWVRYRLNHYLNLKLGLQIPIFNNLNEIKNRTPLLPYVIRPLLYETSFSQLIDVSIGVPYRTFAQIYGYAPVGNAKFDYAAHLGNSPNISSDVSMGSTGRDTTTSFLVGGRVGVRWGDLKAGISGTFDRPNEMTISKRDGPGLGREDALEVFTLDRIRFGADLSYRYGPLMWDGEVILIDYENPKPSIGTDAEFIYGTLGAQATERLVVYGTVWLTEFNGIVAFPDEVIPSLVVEDLSMSIDVVSAGVAYNINDRVVIKAQAAEVEVSAKVEGAKTNSESFEYLATAVSVWF